jgi:hypothetical protein
VIPDADLDLFAREMERSFPFRSFDEHRVQITELVEGSRMHRLYVRFALWSDRRKPPAKRRFV